MPSNPLVRLNALGQSVWYDNIRRSLLVNGDLKRMVEAGEIRGLTSNPSIFEKAIGQSADYDAALRELSSKRLPVEEIYETLAVEDVQSAADLLYPVYSSSNGDDGYVSLEVSPRLADDARATVEDAKRLWNRVSRKNLMIKIPGTKSGLVAVEQAIEAGISVNVTLLFSVKRYTEVMEAYQKGLESRLSQGLAIDTVASVASFFISRFDTLVDPKLDAMTSHAQEASALRGKTAIANAKLAYARFQEVIREDRFRRLQAKGAKVQRPLWASTSTKDPKYPDVYYVEELIAHSSINTMPPATINAYRDHGNPAYRIETELNTARVLPAKLSGLGINLDQCAEILEKEGIIAFQNSFTTLLAAIEGKIGEKS